MKYRYSVLRVFALLLWTVAAVAAMVLSVFANRVLAPGSGVYFWSVGDSDSNCYRLSGFECVDIPDSDDCLLKFHIESQSSLSVGGWSVWSIEENGEIKVMFELDSVGKVPSDGIWDDELSDWTYQYRVVDGKFKKIVVADGLHDVVVRKK